MRTCMVALVAALAASTALAHGPQIQITLDGNTIVTRNVIQDAPFSAGLTAPKTVYVIPLKKYNGAWFAQPNNTPHAVLSGQPKYLSGPGLAYGYDLVDGGPQDFAVGSVLSFRFLKELMRWNGAEFANAGATELKAFRGSNPTITSPASSVAVSNGGPDDLVSLDPVPLDYGSEGVDGHDTVRYALLGDGSSPFSTSPPGIYLAELQVTSTESGLESAPFYFVLHKFASEAALITAVNSLGVDASLVQWVPEPAAAALLAAAAGAALAVPRRRIGA